MPELMSPGECRPVGRAYVCHLRMANVAFVVVKHLRYPSQDGNAEIEVVGPAGGAAQTRPARTLARWFVAWWLPVVAAATFLAPNLLPGWLLGFSIMAAGMLTEHGLFGSYRRRSGTLGAVPIRLALQTSELLSPPDNGPLASATCGARSSIGALAGNTGRSDSAPA